MVDPSVAVELLSGEAAAAGLEAFRDVFEEIRKERLILRVLLWVLVWRVAETPIDRLLFRLASFVASWRGKQPQHHRSRA